MRKVLIVVGVIIAVTAFGSAIMPAKNTSRQTVVTANQGKYLALGDSVAAGVGLSDYSDASACDRTNQAYPFLVATKQHYNLTSVACSGAATEAGLNGSQTVNQLAESAQLDSLLSGERPELITITIGANDAHWISYIQKCYTSSCGSEADTVVVQQSINGAASNLASALTQIKAKYPTQPPRVLLTGYYKLFSPQPAADGCTELTGIDATELKSIAQLQASIDTAVQSSAAQYPFTTYVPINFTGHELCTDNPWIQGLTAKAPYHPTDSGQQAIAQQLIAVLKGKR